jgi:MurNAc alpha-1-phosphate uridylyltransferase
MILAAGLGTRMRPLTQTRPKPLIPVNGKPLIEYHLERCQAAGIRAVVINVSYLGHLIEAQLGTGERWGLDITYSREAEPLDVVGGVRKALPMLGGGAFWCLSADIYTDLALSMVDKDLIADSLGHFLLVPNPPHHPDGDFGLVGGGSERAYLSNKRPYFTYSGMAILTPRLLSEYAPDSSMVRLSPMVRAAIDGQRVSGQVYHGHWSDVGTPQRLAELERVLQARSKSGSAS